MPSLRRKAREVTLGVESELTTCSNVASTRVALCPVTRLRMTGKMDKPDKIGRSPSLPRPSFVYKILANGLAVSTCQHCFYHAHKRMR
jgi:hypothetical protein